MTVNLLELYIIGQIIKMNYDPGSDTLAKTIEKFEAVYLSDLSPSASKPQLTAITSSLFQLVSMFYELISTYIYRSLIVWPIKIKDKKILNEVFSILFTKIANMRVIIHQILGVLQQKCNPCL